MEKVATIYKVYVLRSVATNSVLSGFSYVFPDEKGLNFPNEKSDIVKFIEKR